MDAVTRSRRGGGQALKARKVRRLLRNAAFYVDAAYASGGQTAKNLGYGGSALDATSGSSGSADSNDPQWLPYAGTPYVYLPGVSGNSLQVPDAAALDITGDIDIRVRVALDDWTPAGNMALIAKDDLGSNQSYRFQLTTSGTLSFIYSPTGSGGGLVTATSTTATGVTDGSAKWVRVTRATGSGDVKFYTSDDGSTWSQLGTTVSTAAASHYAGTAALQVGAVQTANNAACKFYRALILDGIGGTTVLDVDTSVATGASTTFTATTGQTVTVNRSTAGRKSAVVTENKWLLGTDDYMEVADSSLLDFTASDDFTVLAVVREWATPTSNRRIVDKADASANNGWLLYGSSTGYSYFLRMNDGTNAAAPASSAGSSGALSVPAFTVNRSTQIATPYLNGTAGATASTTSVASVANATPMRIGRVGGAGTNYADMELVAVAVFRSALNASQITAITNYFTNRGA